MPKLSFKISPFFLQALLDVIEPIEKRLREHLAVSLDGAPDDDEILLEAWRESLLEQLREDADYLVHLLKTMGPENELAMTDAEAESALRAASAVRLKIREAFLGRITEEDLELGNVDLARLGPEEHKPYVCYNFLARFQEFLVAQLMPEFYELDFDDSEGEADMDDDDFEDEDLGEHDSN